MASFYSTVDSVKAYTGIKPEDLGLEDETALNSVITEWLEEAKDLINQDRNRDFSTEDSVPAGINNIAKRIVGNMVAMAILRRETPIIRVDDFDIKLVDDRIFTSAIQKDLSKYPYKSNFVMTVMNKELLDELDEEEDE